MTDIVLLDSDVLSELLTDRSTRRGRPTAARRSSGIAHAGTPKSRARCTCGTCSTCVENARWERIFADKFADPNYYDSLPLRHPSPLHCK